MTVHSIDPTLTAAATSWANLSWALNGTGPPGIYNSSHTPDAEYGTYNWCCMPHVRAQDYIVPENHALVYVEAVQRHHKRTPYAANVLFREDVNWECADEGPYAHARGTNLTSTPVYWQGMRGTANPFEKTVGPGFEGSTCRFPSITTAGLEDARQHGADFRSVYADLLRFLPSGSDREVCAFRVTNNVITSATFGAFVAGLYPDQGEYAAWLQPAAFDSLEPTFPCPAADKLRAEIQQEDEWREHLFASAGLMARFDAVVGLGQDDEAWHVSYDHAYDNLSAKQCHGLRLPCSVNDTAMCVSQDDADTIYRLGNWEYAYTYRSSERSKAYSALKMGPWFRELAFNLRAAAAGDSRVKYRHNFAHDGSMAAILGTLQLANPMWPGMGSELVFELWRASSAKESGGDSKPLRESDFKSDGGQGASDSGGELGTYLGALNMVPLSTLLAYLEHTIPADLVSGCAV